MSRRSRLHLALLCLGGASLALVAGYVNACTLALFRVPVSHTTGALTSLGLELVEGTSVHTWTLIGTLGAFLLGAALSGLVIGSGELRAGRRYGVILIAEGGLLLLAGLLAGRGAQSAVPLAALACGLQNAMASTYRGMVIRTTHTTGLLTDLGLLLGFRLRGRPLPLQRVALLASLLGGFFAGVLLGAEIAHVRGVGAGAVGWAAWPCLVAGGCYLVWRSRRERLRRGALARAAASPGTDGTRSG